MTLNLRHIGLSHQWVLVLYTYSPVILQSKVEVAATKGFFHNAFWNAPQKTSKKSLYVDYYTI